MKWWPTRALAERRLRQQLIREGDLPAGSHPDIGNDARALASIRTIHARIETIRRKLPCELPKWTPQRIRPLAALAKRARELQLAMRDHTLYNTAAGTAEGHRDRERVAVSTTEASGTGADHSPKQTAVNRAAATLVKAHEALIDTDATLMTVMEPQEGGPGHTAPGRTAPGDARPTENSAAQTAGTAKTLRETIPKLKTWRSYHRRRIEAERAGLGPLVDALDERRIHPEDTGDAFDTAYAAWWSEAVITCDPVLQDFSSAEQERNIDRFRRLDDHYRSTTAKLVVLRVRTRVPARDGFTKKSEWGILAHEIQKKQRHKSLRRLMKECPNAIRRLAPCLMMSPLSVAQYLDPETRFDVVILDEASQLTGCDAIGVIARADQVIVAGDPKQMPPSSFFTRQATADEDDDENLESILDDLLACGIPTRHLRMHYRSKCESLIAFSNSRYYGDKLVTFPSQNTRDHALTLVRPEGYYARGGNRDNEGEAKAITREVVRRLTHEDENVRKRSIGVIAVNSQQQRLIENLLDEERSRNPAIEWAFGAKITELSTVVEN